MYLVDIESTPEPSSSTTANLPLLVLSHDIKVGASVSHSPGSFDVTADRLDLVAIVRSLEPTNTSIVINLLRLLGSEKYPKHPTSKITLIVV